MGSETQKLHFIAIGGSVMHNLAIALHNTGHEITGSDDEIFDPAKSKLAEYGLLPKETGWDASKITNRLDAVIVGMHAKTDNPELLKAQEQGIKIYSFPEYIFNQSKDKQRVVIAGSHGKTTITAIVLHILKYFDRKFDYAVGAYIKGFDTMVSFSDAPLVIIEGDEYLSSPIDNTPKFLHYHHHIGLISGIDWDHINVFPTEDEYMKQFEVFADATPKGGSLAFCDEDSMTSIIGNKERPDVFRLPYLTHRHSVEDGVTYLLKGNEKIPVKIFGKHNLQNISGALEIVKKIGISEDQFYEAIRSFEGAAKRLEVIKDNGHSTLFRDYAHAPSKVKATVKAVKEHYPDRELVACLELHTFSSLNKDYIGKYAGTMKHADVLVVYVNPDTLAHKNLSLTEEDIKSAFNLPEVRVFKETEKLVNFIQQQDWNDKNLLMMTSGHFDNLNYESLI